eukprot:366074-Chlamydomonas_euryale.AAC.19
MQLLQHTEAGARIISRQEDVHENIHLPIYKQTDVPDYAAFSSVFGNTHACVQGHGRSLYGGVEKHQKSHKRPVSCLAAEAVQGAALALERVDDIQRCHSLAACMLRVCDRVANDILQEDLEHATRLLIDEAADALDTAAASQAADRRLGDALNVVTEHLAVALGTALAEALAALAASGHDWFLLVWRGQEDGELQ